jgi:hypothetical protein
MLAESSVYSTPPPPPARPTLRTPPPHPRATRRHRHAPWIALDDPAIARHLHNQWRLGRQFGPVNILITHAIADLNTNTDARAGRGGAGTAEGLLNTTSVRVFLHQNPEHVTRLLADMGLTERQAALLDRLPPFTALWQIGPHTPRDHTRPRHKDLSQCRIALGYRGMVCGPATTWSTIP